MKIVFNYLLLLGLAFAVIAHAPEAEADSTFFTKRTILTSFFPKSDKVGFQKFAPTKLQRETLKRQLGYDLSKSSYYFFIATSNTSSGPVIDGYAFIDDEMGQHRPITFAVKLSPEGVVLREEVMVYRESHGDEIRSPRFSKQFKGKTVHDSMRPNKDIDSVSGATISSQAITLGVRRALVLFDIAIAAPKAVRISQAAN
jgi:Na+-translocating ferredoxin:NAD+ oxidoreductase RnfG subunit